MYQWMIDQLFPDQNVNEHKLKRNSVGQFSNFSKVWIYSYSNGDTFSFIIFYKYINLE